MECEVVHTRHHRLRRCMDGSVESVHCQDRFWVCGGCCDERASRSIQPMRTSIARPIHVHASFPLGSTSNFQKGDVADYQAIQSYYKVAPSFKTSPPIHIRRLCDIWLDAVRTYQVGTGLVWWGVGRERRKLRAIPSPSSIAKWIRVR